jgi:hypothetical protein
MTARRTYDFTAEPPAAVLAGLLRASVGIASELGLVLQSPRVRLRPAGTRLLAQLAPYHIRSEEIVEWPGTRNLGGFRSLRHLYRADAGAVEAVIATCGQLYAWENPELPEDIHLLRADGSVLMGSTTQERDAWLVLDDDEHRRLRDAVGGLDELLRPHPA